MERRERRKRRGLEVAHRQITDDSDETNFTNAYTVDRENFHVKIIDVKKFHGVKFSQFCSIREIFLMVDGSKRDEHLKCS